MPTQKNDVIRGPYNGKVLDALGGDDVIYWGPKNGNATIRGGDLGEHYDVSQYFGNAGGDRLYITGSQAINVRFTDTETGTVSVAGQRLNFSGIERFYATSGNDVINGANAKIAPAHGTTPTHGLTIYGRGGHDHITGSKGADFIDPGPGRDTVYGGAGDDVIQSSRGNDLIYGGAGNENIRWGLGDNVAPGNDTIYGGEGKEGIGDLLNMWVVNDNSYIGSRGASVTFTGAESGTAVSTMGGVTSRLRFYEFENTWTHSGNDTVTGANAVIGSNMQGIRINTRWGNDRITGSIGNDTLEGGAGRDTITGGRGNDLIVASSEWYNSRAPGDGDVDTLIFRAGDGADTVYGFDVGIDILNVGGRSYQVIEQAQGTLLRFGGGDSIFLSNVFDFT